MSTDVTPPLDEFLARFDEDDNEWWRTESGHHLNLFEEAVDRMRAAEAEVERLREVARANFDLYHEAKMELRRAITERDALKVDVSMAEAAAEEAQRQIDAWQAEREIRGTGVLLERPAPTPDGSVCPECAAGKHPNCNGVAWDMDKDTEVECSCATRGHRGGTSELG